MKTADLKNLIGKKVVGTNLTILEDVGLKVHRARPRQTFKVQCDCGVIKEYSSDCIANSYKSCGQKTCPFARKLKRDACIKGNEIKHKEAILIENKEHNFFLIKTTYTRYIERAKKRKIEWNLQPEDIESMWVEQDGKCKITGVQLRCDVMQRHTWSLDRIDGTKNYTKDNVQIVSKVYNMVKATRTDDEMRLIAYLISQNTDYKEQRKYNSMTIEEINTILAKSAQTNRR